MSVKRSVIIAPTATQQIKDASDWWTENRSAAADVLEGELRRAFDLVAAHPFIGIEAANVKLAGVRRIQLSRIRYHLYYRLSPDGRTVEVLALWHASRGPGPPL